MSTGDPGQNDSSGLPVLPDGGRPPDALPRQPAGGKPELDAYGVPVQGRPAGGLIYLGMTVCLICAGVSAWAPIMALTYHSAAKVPGWLVVLGFLPGLAACVLAGIMLDRAKKNRLQLGAVSRVILVAVIIVGAIGVSIMGGVMGAQCNC